MLVFHAKGGKVLHGGKLWGKKSYSSHSAKRKVKMSNFEIINAGDGKIIKAWRKGVKFEEKAIVQLRNTAQLPFIFKWMAAMPDTHWGMGSTVGTVLPTKGAVVPAAVGVDIGCGMMAIRTQFHREQIGEKIGDLPEARAGLLSAQFRMGARITGELLT